MDKYYVYRPLIDLIGKTEGTAPPKGRGYNETLAYGAYTGGPVELVKMNLKEIDALQTKMLKHPKNTMNSSAVGWGQIIRTTLRSIKKTLKLPDTTLYNQDTQDQLICYLLGVRGVDKYLAGRLKEDTLINNLAQEWASLPKTTGGGHYAGQNTPITAATVRKVLAEVKKRHQEGQPIEVVEVQKEIQVDKPIVPEKVEKEVRKKTNLLSWFTGIFGAGSAFSTWFSGFNQDTVWIVLGVSAVVIVIMLVGGEWIIRRVRSIKEELET